MALSVLQIGLGVIAGVAAMAAVALWGTSAQAFRIACRPEGSKTDVACSVAAEGRLWSLDSGEYLNIETGYRGWSQALGGECAARFARFRQGARQAWDDLRDRPDASAQAMADPRFYFTCHNRVSS